MMSAVKDMEVPTILNGHTIGTATFTVTATESLNGVLATISFGERQIGELRFNAGTNFEIVMAAVQEKLTPEPSVRVR